MTIPKPDIFDQTNDRALKAYPGLLEQWLPGGKLRGKEYVALNPLRDDKHIDSFSINTLTGKWGEFKPGGAVGGDPISLYAYLKCGGVGNRVQACKELA